MVVATAESAHRPEHRYVALDSLRGIAALAVVVFHLQVRDGFAQWAFFRASNQFVDFFFVLSGFVIAASYGDRLANGFSPLRFFALRLGRVYPLHFVMVMAGVMLECVAWAFGPHGLAPQGVFAGLHSPGHALRALLLLDGLFVDRGNAYSGASWSISVELVLYALAIVTFRLRMIGAMLLLGLGLAGLLAQGFGVEAPVFTGSVQRGLAGFGCGVGCWWLHRARGGAPLPLAAWLEPLALGALFAAIGLAPLFGHYELVVVPAVLVVLVFAGEAGPLARGLRMRPFVWLGTISYAVYMVHGFVLARLFDTAMVASRWLAHPVVELVWSGGVPVRRLAMSPAANNALCLLLIAVVLAVAHGAWRWIEEPCRQWSRRRVEAQP
jgi:peptidoglycan/LPS O-acetylase OafA/YrhL